MYLEIRRKKLVSRLKKSSNPDNWFIRLVDALPIILPTALAAFSVVAILSLLQGRLQNTIVWPLGLLAAVSVSLVVFFKYRLESKDKTIERVVCNLLVMLFVILWMGFNAANSSQHVFTNRDPATYTVTGIWLTKHRSLNIHPSTVFDKVDRINGTSAGFASHRGDASILDAQGVHLLPVLLGLIGRIVGVGRMLHFNVLFGGIALLAFYGLARQLTKPKWALLACVAIGLSLPMIYFSRDTYTEPLAMAFIFGGLSLIGLANQYKRSSLWLLAGLVSGAAALTRIDAFIGLAALAGFAYIYLALTLSGQRLINSWRISLMLVAAAFVSVVGWLDVSKLSTVYYKSEWRHMKPELELLWLVLIAGLVLVTLAWATNLIDWLDDKTKSWRAKISSWAVALVTLVLASRPLWMVANGVKRVVNPDGSTQTLIQRSYNEQTFNWIWWYMGPILAFMAIVGMIIVLRRILARRQVLLMAFCSMFVANAAIYLIRPAISADQVWASRRFLPVILPGVSLLGIMGLGWLYENRTKIFKKLDGTAIVSSLITLSVISPIIVSLPSLFIKQNTQLAAVNSVCPALPPKAAVLWVGQARAQMVEPTKLICGVPAEGFGRVFGNAKPDQQTLSLAAQHARQAGYTPIMGAYGTNSDLIGGQEGRSFTTVSTFSYFWLEQPYTRPPFRVLSMNDTMVLAQIDSQGKPRPLYQPLNNER